MRKIVVKIGSSVIAPGGKLDSALISRLVKDILAVEKKGYKVILVSSGAIACGLNALGYKRKPHDIHSLMAISSCGQIMLMDVFNEKFKKSKRICAQMLLTWDDFDNREKFINIKKTLDKLLSMNIIPVVNENDAISSQEISVGDNDWLSARVADLAAAEQLIILSDVEGLFAEDSVIKKVEKIDDQIKSMVRKSKTTHTSGGMDTKLEAATFANLSGIKTVIASGHIKNVLLRVVKGEDLGTVFTPSAKIAGARKRWILNKQIKGTLFIDEGAKEAFINKGKSLLGVGVTGYQGAFKSGDGVVVADERGCVLGCGIVNYSIEEFSPKKKFEKEVVHRDNFVQSVEGWCYRPYRHSPIKQKKR